MNYDQYYVSFEIGESNLFRINMPISEMKEAYKKGIEIIGFDPFGDCIFWDRHAERSFISIENMNHIHMFEKHELIDLFDCDSKKPKTSLYLHEFSFNYLYLRICKLGNSLFKYHELSGTNVIRFHD